MSNPISSGSPSNQPYGGREFRPRAQAKRPLDGHQVAYVTGGKTSGRFSLPDTKATNAQKQSFKNREVKHLGPAEAAAITMLAHKHISG